MIGKWFSLGVSALITAVRGHKPTSRQAEKTSDILGILATVLSFLTLPALFAFMAVWEHIREPLEQVKTGYRLPPLDPMIALKFCLLLSILGFALGALAIRMSPSGRGGLRGRQGTALAMSFAVLASIFTLPMRGANKSPRKAICLSNVKQMSLALQMYAEENDDVLPSTTLWCDQITGYIKHQNAFLCPDSWGTPCSYAYNSILSEVRLLSVSDPVSTIAIFESNKDWNASGGWELLPKEPRHLGGDNYALADGSAKWIRRSEIGRENGTWKWR